MRVICDSGAFTIYQIRNKTPEQKKKRSRNVVPDDETFFQEYVKFAKENPDLDGFINLDVIFQGEESFKNFIRLRKELPSNVKLLPVYHNSTPIELLQKYLDETDHGGYIAVGAVAGLDMRAQVTNLRHVFDMCKNYPNVKLHGLGVTSISMSVFPWYSVDSTSWVQFTRYGVAIIPRLKGNKWTFPASPINLHVTSAVKKDKSKMPISRLSKFEQDMIKDYLENHLGIAFGVSHFEDGKEIIDVPGIINDHVIRDFANACYYMELARDLGVKMYLGGNFPQMGSVEKETKVAVRMKELYGEYNRFISFFYQDEANTVMSVFRKFKSEETNES